MDLKEETQSAEDFQDQKEGSSLKWFTIAGIHDEAQLGFGIKRWQKGLKQDFLD